jgi:hypothetical protein
MIDVRMIVHDLSARIRMALAVQFLRQTSTCLTACVGHAEVIVAQIMVAQLIRQKG